MAQDSGSRSGQQPTTWAVDQAALLGVILIGVLTVAVGPGPFTFLSTAIGLTLLIALAAFGSVNGRSRGKRLGVAAAVGLCTVLTIGVVVEQLYNIKDPPGSQTEYVRDLWLGGCSAAVGLASSAIAAVLLLNWRRVRSRLDLVGGDKGLMVWWNDDPDKTVGDAP
jgi:hypothetical protein